MKLAAGQLLHYPLEASDGAGGKQVNDVQRIRHRVGKDGGQGEITVAAQGPAASSSWDR